MLKRTLLLMYLSVGVIWTVQGIASEEAAPDAPSHNFPLAEQLSDSALAEKRDDYLSQRSWVLGFNERTDGSTFYLAWGQSDVRVNSSDLAFPDARVAAFEEALLLAKAELVKYRSTSISTKTYNSSLIDERPFDPATLEARSSLRALGDKIMALGEASLDSLLQKLGVDPRGLSSQEKRTLARNTFQKTVLMEAMSSVAGARPVSSFEDERSIGVLMMYSEDQRQLAQSIRTGTASASPKKAGKADLPTILKQSLPNDVDHLFQHGVRLIYDHQGTPWFISFAQAGVKTTRSSNQLQQSMALRASRETASALARGQMAEFLQGTVSYSSRTELLSDVEVAEISQGEMVSERETINIGKLIQTQIRQSAQVRIDGITTFRQWTANHPETGHLIVGEVAVWSPLTQAQARNSNTSNDSSQSASRSARRSSGTVRISADFESEAGF